MTETPAAPTVPASATNGTRFDQGTMTRDIEARLRTIDADLVELDTKIAHHRALVADVKSAQRILESERTQLRRLASVYDPTKVPPKKRRPAAKRKPAASSRSPNDPERAAKQASARNLWIEGRLSVKEIAKRLEVSDGTIHYWAKTLGWPKKRGRDAS